MTENLKPSALTWLVIALAVIICSTLLAALALRQSSYIEPFTCRWGLESSEVCNSAYREELTAFQIRADALTPAGSILFFGDSIIQGLGVSAISPLALNYGIGSETAAELVKRFPKYPSTKNAKAVVLLTGINDLKTASDDALLSTIDQLLVLITDSVFYCHALLPIDEPVRSDWQSRSNERIRQFNEKLQPLCEGAGGEYIDVAAELMDDSGNLKAEHHIGDGLHPSTLGNITIARNIARVLADANLL